MFLQQAPRIHLCLEFSRISNWFWQVQVLLRNEKGPGSLRPCQCFQKKKIKPENWSEQKLGQKTDQKRTENVAFGKKLNFAFA